MLHRVTNVTSLDLVDNDTKIKPEKKFLSERGIGPKIAMENS